MANEYTVVQKSGKLVLISPSGKELSYSYLSQNKDEFLAIAKDLNNELDAIREKLALYKEMFEEIEFTLALNRTREDHALNDLATIARAVQKAKTPPTEKYNVGQEVRIIAGLYKNCRGTIDIDYGDNRYMVSIKTGAGIMGQVLYPSDMKPYTTDNWE